MILSLRSSDGLVYLIRFGCYSEVVGISRISTLPPQKKNAVVYCPVKRVVFSLTGAKNTKGVGQILRES